MRAYWGKGKYEYNVELCFSVTLSGDGYEAIRLIAKDVYNLHVNGQFVCYGPARSAKGTARVDEISLKEHLQKGDNRLDVFVIATNSKTLCFSDDEPYFGAEIISNGKVVLSGEDFDCYQMKDRVTKVEKMSYQRTFTEIYRAEKDRAYHSSAYEPIKKVEVKTPLLLERNVEFTKNETVEFSFYETGSVDPDGKATWENDFTRRQLEKGINLFGYTRAECDQKISIELDEFVYKKGESKGRYKYFAYKLPAVNVGKFDLKITAKTDITLWLIYDDILVDGLVKFNREQIIHGLKWTLKKGEYRLLSGEVYQAKYATLILDGEARIDGVSMITVQNPLVKVGDYKLEDEELEEIVNGAIRTFVHNAYDLPTDCASRERAGYLCDGFFTARAEQFFTNGNKTERNLLENYLLYKNEVYDHDGVLPTCYPSSPKSKDEYIPNWMLWYIVQLGDCLKRTGDKAFIDLHRQKVYLVLDFFRNYENEYGFLENLDGWVFVEWSKANDFTSGVNFPSNMLYAGALATAGEMYGDGELLKKASSLRQKIREFAFDGELFTDNAERVDGKLVLTDNTSETCQNYAAFFDVATPEDSPEFFKLLDKRFGADDKDFPRKVYPSNMFIGFILRLVILFREGKYEKLLEESKRAFLPMVRLTGTVWEHFEDHSSCNHGFGSIVGALIVMAYRKLKEKGGA